MDEKKKGSHLLNRYVCRCDSNKNQEIEKRSIRQGKRNEETPINSEKRAIEREECLCHKTYIGETRTRRLGCEE